MRSNQKAAGAGRFWPRSIEEVFGIYLSRELGDEQHAERYIRLSAQHPLPLLLIALRRARAGTAEEYTSPERFFHELSFLVPEKGEGQT
jgi:hypothetical protein